MTHRDDEWRDTTPESSFASISRLLTKLFPAAFETDVVEERRQSRILIGYLLILTTICVVSAVSQALLGGSAGTRLALSVLALNVILLACVRQGISRDLLAHATIGLLYLAGAGLLIASGGGSVPGIVIICTLPVFSLVLEGPGWPVRWLGIGFASVVLTSIYTSQTDSYLYPPDSLLFDKYRFVVTTAMLAFVGLAVVVLEWARRSADGELNASKVQFEKQDERYRALFENVGDIVMEFERDDQCIYVSDNCEEMTGHGASRFLGQQFLGLLHPQDFPPLQAAVRKLRENPTSTQRMNLRIEHADGHFIYGQMSIRTYLTPENRRRIVSVFRDITDLRKAELTIRHSERLATAGTLAAGVAHQINNPIGSIRMASEYALLCARDGDLEGIESVLNDNVEQATRCGEIVKSLLQFSVSHESPTKVTQELVGIVRRAQEFTAGYARERSIEVRVSASDAPYVVEVSSIEVEQVFVNLIRNAIESGPLSGRVEIAISRLGGIARVEIKDDGCGISEVDQAHIFDPFFTTRIRDGGTGLGLSVAHGIVRDHGGAMEIDSSLGKGTRVQIDLPLAGVESPGRNTEERTSDGR